MIETINISSADTNSNLSPKLIEKMAKSGCVGLYIGAESGSERMLKYMRKGETREDFIEKMPIIHASGMTTYTTWVFGLPSETEKDRDDTRRFIEDLNYADLMISYSSTTIEEALYARKPVGLFGGTNRYYHLKGSSIPPSTKNRNAVYHLTNQNLVTMLSSILNFHKSSLLTDEELNGYIWDSNISDYAEFLEYLNK